MSLKVLTENLDKVPVKEQSYVVTSMREVNENLQVAYNKMKTIREQAAEVQAQWKALQEDIDGVCFAKFLTNGSLQEQFLKAVDQLKLEYEDAKSTYLHYKELKNKILTEDNDDISSDVRYDYEDEDDRPVHVDTIDEIDDTTVSSSADVDEEVVAEITRLLDSGDNEDLLDYLFNSFVPEVGQADTFVGELIRALMHILFVYRLSNLTFYQDQGISECGGSAQFIIDNGYETEMMSMMSKDDVSNYYTDILEVVKKVAGDIISDTSMLTKSNTTDSEAYSYDRIVETAPHFTYTIFLPYNVSTSIEKGQTLYLDAVDYILSKIDFSDSVSFEDPYNDLSSVELLNLTKDQFMRVEEIFSDMKNAWSDFEVVDSDEVTTNVEPDDIFMMSDDDTVDESLEATNISLTEDTTDEREEEFLRLHNNKENYKKNKKSFEKVYLIFDSYGFGANEDVLTCFKQLSEDDKDIVLTLIRER